jgi:hemerythrin-like domain-containing protein
MTDVSGIEVLLIEHRAILRMLDVTRELAHLLEAGADVPPDMLDSVAEFMRGFGNEHLRKEEEYVFPALRKRGALLDGMAIESLQRDHDRVRLLLEKMSAAATAYREHRPKADRNWGRFASEYAAVLRRHIDKEQEVFYPAAEQLLSADQHRDLAESLRRRAEESLPQDGSRRFSELANTMAADLLVLTV